MSEHGHVAYCLLFQVGLPFFPLFMEVNSSQSASFFELFLLPFKSVSLAWNAELYLYPSVPIDVLVAKSRSILVAPWIVAHQAPLSWGFSRHARILE